MVTPEDDVDRLRERLERAGHITDEESFERTWKNYMGEELSNKQRNILKEKVKGKILGTEKTREPPKERKRLLLRKKKVVRRKKVITGKKRIIKKTVIVEPKRRKVRFVFTGKQKGRTTTARRIKTSRGDRFIDKKGRYVSVKK